ncbi:hypothetical protein AMAG_16213 [Allomyces macrogynus ATCC 38327]|uniref:Uncharacterized protein n=1 Tax=Allomyces macrogynus (strain ATCC 38327) TaxID=578462 RepID=A0A0L0TA85_ALLM3|nr:hypothetical protein AMAG_16213 [Allomyces macrogynus ATCC 38327]|eukprot:KNE71657.1 hypothetical protein AMAG_16213 [Allomyces macrogynus ATCC 38327]
MSLLASPPPATATTATLAQPPRTWPQVRAEIHDYFTWTPDRARIALLRSGVDPVSAAATAASLRGPPAPPELARFSTFTGLGMFWGFLLGGALGAQHAGLQFLAENAHKLPVTVQGWYFYHKAKNYRSMWGAVKRGTVYAGRLGVVVGLFAAVETGLDLARGKDDLWSATAAGVVTATTFAAAYRLPRASVQRTLLYGTVTGLLVGGIQDLLSVQLGYPAKYRIFAGDNDSVVPATVTQPSSAAPASSDITAIDL